MSSSSYVSVTSANCLIKSAPGVIFWYEISSEFTYKTCFFINAGLKINAAVFLKQTINERWPYLQIWILVQPLAIFILLGTIPDDKDRLIIWVNGIRIESIDSFIRNVDILSCPWLFLFFNFDDIFLSSTGVLGSWNILLSCCRFKNIEYCVFAGSTPSLIFFPILVKYLLNALAI